MIYAGIGSRKTPIVICDHMKAIARTLAARGFTLRSGGAKGADKAFQIGCALGFGKAELYLTQNVIGDVSKSQPYFDHAARFHPAWEQCSFFVKTLHARNSMIMMGCSLIQPVDFVVCWTPDGMASGGTGQALRIAEAYSIPVFNLHDTTAAQRLEDWLKK
jgi:hypothetical protein